MSIEKVKGKYIDPGLKTNGLIDNQGVFPASYKPMVVEESSITHNGTPRLEVTVENKDDPREIKIEEHIFGDYECLNFILSEKQEKHIVGPWMKMVIMKMLGKHIGFKAIEN